MEKINRFSASTNSPSAASCTTATSGTAAGSLSVDSSNSNRVCSTRSIHNSSSNYISSSLRALNKSSYKISKPISQNPNPNLFLPSPPPSSAILAIAPQQQQPQPPVYNIVKNDFCDVQKLTGSPAHFSNRSPPPQHAPPSVVTAATPPQPPHRSSAISQPLSHLHLIRSPPLAKLPPHHPSPITDVPPAAGMSWVRPSLSPLPPFPTVSEAAESPISAYMRRLHSGQHFFVSSLLEVAPPQLLPSSPLSFGCAPSPRTATAYQLMLSPTLLFPSSPGMPIPSPK